MLTFNYEVRGAEGTVTGTLEAANLRQAVASLQREGYVVLSIREASRCACGEMKPGLTCPKCGRSAFGFLPSLLKLAFLVGLMAVVARGLGLL